MGNSSGVQDKGESSHIRTSHPTQFWLWYWHSHGWNPNSTCCLNFLSICPFLTPTVRCPLSPLQWIHFLKVFRDLLQFQKVFLRPFHLTSLLLLPKLSSSLKVSLHLTSVALKFPFSFHTSFSFWGHSTRNSTSPCGPWASLSLLWDQVLPSPLNRETDSSPCLLDWTTKSLYYIYLYILIYIIYIINI